MSNESWIQQLINVFDDTDNVEIQELSALF